MGRAELLEGIAEDGSKIHFDEIEATGEAANVIRWTRSHVTASIECSAQANVVSFFQFFWDFSSVLLNLNFPVKKWLTRVFYAGLFGSCRRRRRRSRTNTFWSKYPRKISFPWSMFADRYFFLVFWVSFHFQFCPKKIERDREISFFFIFFSSWKRICRKGTVSLVSIGA